MLSVNTNLSSLFSQRKIKENQEELSKSIEKLSSGKRINYAKDDGAGLEISSDMATTIRATQSLSRNINDGISLAQVADSALSNVDEILQRTRELAIQANNGTLNANNRKVLNQEFLQLKSEIDRIANSTEIFGIHPLKGDPPLPKPNTVAQTIITSNTPHITDIFSSNGQTKIMLSGIKPIAYVPSGAENLRVSIYDHGADDDIQVFTRSGKHLIGTPASDAVWKNNSIFNANDFKNNVLLEESGFDKNAQYDDSQLIDGHNNFGLTDPLPLNLNFNGMNIDYSGDGDSLPNRNERIIIDKTTEPLLIMVVGVGSFSVTAAWDKMPPKDAIEPEPTNIEIPEEPAFQKPIDIVVETQYDQKTNVISINKAPSTIKDLKIEDVVIDPFEEARKALEKLSKALEKVSNYRSYYGSIEQRLNFSLSNLYSNRQNLEAAHSRIVDADYARVIAELARSQILVNSASAMQSQANVQIEKILSLLIKE